LKFFSYYSFTLRIIDLIDKHKIHFKDRFEKQISDYVEIDFYQKENNTINIHNLLPGRYEICVNFLNQKNQNIYYRSSNSCLHIPWNVSEHEKEQPNLFIHLLFFILIIILLVAIAFFIYSLHQYFKSRKPPSAVPIVMENVDENNDNAERIKFLVNQHFVPRVNPLELLVRRRIHQRYAVQSPD
jgi:ATP-dependent Zn protease